jgi:Ser/Thr protein kinase RdoA (MazF antagonist)
MIDSSHLDRAAREVLSYFPALAGHDRPRRHAAGFSGAAIWRVDCPERGRVSAPWAQGSNANPLDGVFCLRAWPPVADLAQIRFCHQLLADLAPRRLSFVPVLMTVREGQTSLQHAGRCWEVHDWMPGVADFHSRPSPAKLAEACRALAQVHESWGRLDQDRVGSIPGVRRRLELAEAWQALVRQGWQPGTAVRRGDPVHAIAESAWPLMSRLVHEALEQLRLLAVLHRLQPCLRDPWHDHFLFDDDRLTGLVDYANAGFDHPAVDLARALGSLVGDDGAGWQAGLTAYRQVRPFTDADEGLARILDRTGVILSASNWLIRLDLDPSSVCDRAAAAERLAVLVRRMEAWER